MAWLSTRIEKDVFLLAEQTLKVFIEQGIRWEEIKAAFCCVFEIATKWILLYRNLNKTKYSHNLFIFQYQVHLSPVGLQPNENLSLFNTPLLLNSLNLLFFFFFLPVWYNFNVLTMVLLFLWDMCIHHYHKHAWGFPVWVG